MNPTEQSVQTHMRNVCVTRVDVGWDITRNMASAVSVGFLLLSKMIFLLVNFKGHLLFSIGKMEY